MYSSGWYLIKLPKGFKLQNRYRKTEEKKKKKKKRQIKTDVYFYKLKIVANNQNYFEIIFQ